MRTTLAIAAAAGLAMAPAMAFAEYPERAISVMVPFGAGGGTDVPARFFAAEMEKILGPEHRRVECRRRRRHDRRDATVAGRCRRLQPRLHAGGHDDDPAASEEDEL